MATGLLKSNVPLNIDMNRCTQLIKIMYFSSSSSRKREEFILPSSHLYFYQVQLQMFLTGIHSSYFVVFTNVDLVSVLVTFDEEFIQSKLSAAKLFWERCIIPEMIGAAFSHPKLMVENADIENSYSACWCKKISR